MECGARTRAGTPCKRRDIYRSGRCKLHGGMSTGPRTDEGKTKSAANGRCKPHEGMT
ncbi:HGGxSTG domain-containing protein [Novosphingobium sp. PP1Y]|uniref:HGGxSTG domain-containing protein n=1 Tax=Novosphingobium sp. PP1Y TaxID=702113 RepID=UPI00350EA739